MEDLNKLLKTEKLVDIEQTLVTGFDNLEIGFYDAKLAVMLAMIITAAMKKFDQIEKDDFPSELNDKFKSIKELYEKKVDILNKHLSENATIIRAIEESDSRYPQLENDISNLLKEFDSLIKEKVETRDKLPLSAC